MAQREEEIAHEVCEEYSKLSGMRGNWESHWQEIAERLISGHKDLFQSRGLNTTKGDKRTQFIFDSTPSIALGRFASILDSLLTPRNQIYDRIQTSNFDLNKDRQVREYFEEVTRLLFKYRYASFSNFQAQNFKNYRSIGGYGTGVVFTDRGIREPGLRYRNIHLSESYLAENHQGIVDRVVRYFPLTALQAYQFWGEKLSDKIKEQMKRNPHSEFYFIHCVKERKDQDPERRDFRGMPFVSYYVSVDDKMLLEESGYTSFPYSVFRYDQVEGEVYGRSPAMEVLPAVKTLNEEKKTVLKQGHRSVDPVLLTHDDGILDMFSLKPGSAIPGAVSKEGRALVQTLPVGNVAIGKDLMDDERRVINDAFLVNLFQILVESPQMTATETIERAREKGILLAPTIGRIEADRAHMIDREIDLLSRQGLLPPQPDVLREASGEYRIVNDSPLSRLRRSEEASGLLRTVESALNVVNVTQDLSPLDHFDWDEIIPDIAEIQGVPVKWMRGLQEVAAIRAQRAEAQAEQTAIQAGPSIASVVKATSNG